MLLLLIIFICKNIYVLLAILCYVLFFVISGGIFEKFYGFSHYSLFLCLLNVFCLASGPVIVSIHGFLGKFYLNISAVISIIFSLSFMLVLYEFMNNRLKICLY
jgi:hypothetical protein